MPLPTRTRVKICGITRADDAARAAILGADAIGVVFYSRSPRAVTIEQALAIGRARPPFVALVGLFVNPEPDLVETVLQRVPLDLLQFHGDECEADCERYGRPYLKSVSMRPGVDVVGYARCFEGAVGLLLDTHREGVPGGTGEAFDWSLVPRDFGRPVILAGGLRPDNVARAIAEVRPYGVDVSSGVESRKGIKDDGLMAAFMRGVHSVQSD